MERRIITTEITEEDRKIEPNLRPQLLREYIGQEKIKANLKVYIDAARGRGESLDHVLFYGPPGLGKTTLSGIIANEMGVHMKVTSGPAIEKPGEMAAILNSLQEGDVLFVDEIHRFNKGQQDYLLPFVEDGTLILIGATTENPYFEVNSALISRSIIFELKALEKEDIKKLLQRAVYDRDKGMGAYDAVLAEDAMEFLAEMAGGDARHALNAIELGIMTTNRSEDGKIHITLEVAQECIQKRVIRYDKTGDNHYDTISAFIKSMRGVRPGRGGLLSGKDALCRGKRYLCGKADYDLRRRGRGKRRPAGAFRCRFRIPCGRAGGNAGGSRLFFPRRPFMLPARPRATPVWRP